MRPPAQRAWHHCLSLYGARWDAAQMRKLCEILAPCPEAAQAAWEEAGDSLRCLHAHAKLMGRHAWAVATITAATISLAGCQPLQVRHAHRTPASIPGTQSAARFQHRFEPVGTGDAALDVRARICTCSKRRSARSTYRPF